MGIFGTPMSYFMIQRRLYFFGLFLIISFFSYGQTPIDTAKFLPGIDSLKCDLKKYYDQKTAAEILEYNYSVKNKWLRFIPTIGFTVVPLSPILAINTHGLAQFAEHTAQKKAKIMNIERMNSLQYEKECISLSYQYLDLKSKIIVYNFKVDNFALQTSKFEITKKAYNNNEIPPSEYLNRQIEYNNLISDLKSMEMELNSLKYKILAQFNYNP